MLLTWYDGSHASGHFRVVKGYDDSTNVFIVHDPWYTGPYQAPNVRFNQNFFVDDLWTKRYRWGTLISPWEVEIDAPPEVLQGEEFTVTANVSYRGPHPFEGQDPASSPEVTLELGIDFTPAPSETGTKPLSGITTSGTSDAASWQVAAGSYLVSTVIGAVARGLISDSSYSYPSYSDSIGGTGSVGLTMV